MILLNDSWGPRSPSIGLKRLRLSVPSVACRPLSGRACAGQCGLKVLKTEEREANPAERKQAAGSRRDRGKRCNHLLDRHGRTFFELTKALCGTISSQ